MGVMYDRAPWRRADCGSVQSWANANRPQRSTPSKTLPDQTKSVSKTEVTTITAKKLAKRVHS